MTQYLKFPNFDPIVFSIGPISLHWYGVMYLFGIFGALLLANYRIKQPNSGWTKKQVENLLFWGFIALFIGGRLGYTLFYNFAVFRQDPTVVFRVWEGGMSFHGGLIGGLIAVAIFAKLNNKKFMQVSDFIAPLIPIGLMFGRLGNFINGELWGRVTDSSIGMIFPTSRQADILYLKAHPQLEQLFVENGYFLPRHPSQLYELFFEGLVLFMILNYFILNKRPAGSVTGLAILCYGVFRFMIEFFRQPDEQLGLYLNFISMGQILCLPMIFGGIILLRYAYRSNQKRDEK